MRLIQFNSGLRVVLKDVQQQAPPDRSERRYFVLPAAPAHHSSNTSIGTTSSSSKSNVSTGTAHDYYVPRAYQPATHSTIYPACAQVKTPPVVNPIPASTLTVEVGTSRTIRWSTTTTRSGRARRTPLSCRMCMCHVDSNARHVRSCLTFFTFNSY